MTEQEETGAAVRRARLARGLSLRALAGQLGVSPATLSAVENGRTPLSVPRLQRIAELLEVTPGQLLRAELPVAPAPVDPAPSDWRSFANLDLGPLLEAATRLFVRQGFHSTSIREIAAEVGLSVAGVYHHYPSKERIMARLMDTTMAEIRWRLIAARDDGETAAERFALMVESLALFHVVRGDLAFLGASEMRGLTGKNLARSTHQRAEVQHMLDEQAELAIADGDFTTPEPRTAARAIATMCTSLPSWFRTDGPITPGQVARSYATYAVAMMRSG
ncbi:TetR family transcriptional regulator [Nocardioides sp. AE5]|uniref:TetR family transcriptional regulator n=1 Tax=Nocardioides sp. AE5 TaxID=2962573 RepID=UPI0028815297|nr:TetR family transcriptional regulator [Nocardioides sp. AE5]MDT0200459.1 TetR family transcriptional regulator [Nocardioides sp. AE5]